MNKLTQIKQNKERLTREIIQLKKEIELKREELSKLEDFQEDAFRPEED